MDKLTRHFQEEQVEYERIYHNLKNCTDPACSETHKHITCPTLQNGVPCGIETCERIAYTGQYCSQFHVPQHNILYVRQERPVWMDKEGE